MKISVLLVCIVCALPCLGCRAVGASARLPFDNRFRGATRVLRSRNRCFVELAANSHDRRTSRGAPRSFFLRWSQPPTAPPTVAAAPPLDAQQSFGLSGSAIAAHEEAAGARPAKVAKIEARVVGLSLTGNGRTVFTFDNSQMWRQIESDGDMLARLGDSATISRGLLGSYWLQLKSGRGCKVTRIR